MIDVKNIGSSINYPERPIEDTYSNSNGLGDWVFMHFTTPFRVQTPKGIVERPAGEFLINSPTYPQWHQGIGHCFKNDWFIFNDEYLENYINDLQIPINTPFRHRNPDKVISIFIEIQRENIMKDNYWKVKSDLLVKEMFVEIARGLNSRNNGFLTEREKELLPGFQNARVKIQQSLSKKWKVEEMAELVSLSPNRFAILYNKFFNISPVKDLLETRLHLAKGLLIFQTAKIEAIAEQCGFSSVHYFWRMFKKRFGISPSDFRKAQRLNTAHEPVRLS